METLMEASKIQSIPAAIQRVGLFGITMSAAVENSAPYKR
jgi:hypothetical protein